MTSDEKNVLQAMSEKFSDVGDSLLVFATTLTTLSERLSTRKLLEDDERKNIRKNLDRLATTVDAQDGVMLNAFTQLGDQIGRLIDTLHEIGTEVTSINNVTSCLEDHENITTSIKDHLLILDKNFRSISKSFTLIEAQFKDVATSTTTKNKAVIKFIERISPFIIAGGAALVALLK